MWRLAINHTKFSLVVGLIVLLLLPILLSCSPSASTPLIPSKGSKNQIVIALGWGDLLTGFDPTLGWAYHDHPLFQSTLLRRDQNLQLVKDLATDYSLSADKKIWTFKIREDVLFTDGVPLTAADVAYTFNQAKASPGLTDLTMLEQAWELFCQNQCDIYPQEIGG